jgi:putative transposase
MAAAFVETLGRGYASVNPTPDAQSVIAQLPLRLQHYSAFRAYEAWEYRLLGGFSGLGFQD